MNLFTKIYKVIFDRPTQLFGHLRGTYLFYQTYFLRVLFLNNRSELEFGDNVRLQAFKTLMAEKDALIKIGDNSIIYENATIGAYGKGIIEIGNDSIIGDAKIVSRYKIAIGSNFLTSWNVYIQDFEPHPIEAPLRSKQVSMMVNNFYPKFTSKGTYSDFSWNEFPSAPIIIGNNVWLGANVTILKGVNIGNNCIVATGSVVLKGDYPPNSLLAGNPAKVVKSI